MRENEAMAGNVALRSYVVYDERNVDLLDDLLTPTYVGQVNGREIAGVAAARDFIRVFLAAFPDVHYTVEDTVASGDKVVIRWSATATHGGTFAGIEPANRRAKLQGAFFRQQAARSARC